MFKHPCDILDLTTSLHFTRQKSKLFSELWLIPDFLANLIISPTLINKFLTFPWPWHVFDFSDFFTDRGNPDILPKHFPRQHSLTFSWPISKISLTNKALNWTPTSNFKSLLDCLCSGTKWCQITRKICNNWDVVCLIYFGVNW